jgi:hypothetical protein
VAGVVQGFAANTVATQQPTPGTTVLDTGAPTITLTLARNPAYDEHGTPENDAPYAGTAIKLPANVPQKPVTSGPARVEPVPVPQSVLPAALPAVPTVTTPASTPTSVPTTPAVTTPATVTTPTPTPTPVTTPSVTPVTPVQPVTTPAVTPVTPAPVSSTPRTPDFTVPGAPKEPVRTQSLPDRVAALAAWMEAHQAPSAPNLNHWLYEHAYIVAGARFGWWHGAQALQALIEVDRRAEALWGVGSQSRTTAQKALAEVRSRAG